MLAGIEIGGTKLQLGVGKGDGSKLTALERFDVDPDGGAEGILGQIQAAMPTLIRRHEITGVGVGFGGPVESATGTCIKSHQIDGWDSFPMTSWCRASFDLPATVGNDCDCATLAEARFGAGAGHDSVFYVTVGTGVGGGFYCDGRLHGLNRPAIAEIGHLRPGLHADRPEATVESIASGWGISAAAQDRVSGFVATNLESRRRQRTGGQRGMTGLGETESECHADLRQRCNQDLEQLTAKHVAQAAQDGNAVAVEVLLHACESLGWAIAQVITLMAPEVVVVGGGVSLIGEQSFFVPLRAQIERYVFPPLKGSYQVVPAELGELVVVHGALARARQLEQGN